MLYITMFEQVFGANEHLSGDVAVGDVAVLLDGSVVVVKTPCQVEGDTEVRIIAQRTRRVAARTASAAEFELDAQCFAVPQNEVAHNATWSPLSERRILVLHPL